MITSMLVKPMMRILVCAIEKGENKMNAEVIKAMNKKESIGDTYDQ